MLRASMFAGTRPNEHEWYCELDPIDNNGKRGAKIQFENSEMFEHGGYVSGVTTVFGDITVRNGKAIVSGVPEFVQQKEDNDVFGRRLLATGDKSVLVIRVDANDAQNQYTEEQLAEEIFGEFAISGSTDTFNLASGYRQCSYGQLNIDPTDDPKANYGVYTAALTNIGNMSMAELEPLALAAGNLEFCNLSSLFDFVMICLPPLPNDKDRVAYAWAGSYLSVYQDDACVWPSVQMHEVGHNLGLMHSGEGCAECEYDDMTGMMGSSHTYDDGPLKCFNNPKTWQLGWFSDRHATATPLSLEWSGRLVGSAEYLSAAGDDVIVLKVEGHSEDFYVGLNRQIGINAGTEEAGDKVTIQRRDVGDGYSLSWLEAKLTTGGTYIIENFGGSNTDVTIEVSSIDIASVPGVAHVRVYANNHLSPVPTPPNITTVIPSPTPSTVSSPTPSSPPFPNPVPTPSSTCEIKSQIDNIETKVENVENEMREMKNTLQVILNILQTSTPVPSQSTPAPVPCTDRNGSWENKGTMRSWCSWARKSGGIYITGRCKARNLYEDCPKTCLVCNP
mmetsp:Transcript_25048/g.37462  ORF Transcript_25048/g.37462 Transcript_25048/m.37462 type:complete len:561 (-) Transcript_25048:233-1915(-)